MKEYKSIRVRKATWQRIVDIVDKLAAKIADEKIHHYGKPQDNNNDAYRGLTIDRFLTQLLDQRELHEARDERYRAKKKARREAESDVH